MAGERVFGVGAYDLSTTSYLLGIGERTLVRWASPSRTGLPPLIEPTLVWAYTFHDLLSLAIVRVLHDRGISPSGVRRTHEAAKELVNTSRPFARADLVEQLATVPGSVIYGGEADLTAGHQGVLPGILAPYLVPVEYGDDLLARLWRPADRVQLDPEIQVGHPCLIGTRVTTDVVADRYRQGEDVALIADDLDLSMSDVRKAIRFEEQLAAGEGLARAA